MQENGVVYQQPPLGEGEPDASQTQGSQAGARLSPAGKTKAPLVNSARPPLYCCPTWRCRSKLCHCPTRHCCPTCRCSSTSRFFPRWRYCPKRRRPPTWLSLNGRTETFPKPSGSSIPVKYSTPPTRSASGKRCPSSDRNLRSVTLRFR